MVQGLPAVKWTPENNAKLLQALVIMHAGVLDYKKLAAIFGKFAMYFVILLGRYTYDRISRARFPNVWLEFKGNLPTNVPLRS